jgi:N-acetylmuramoyl-L-alanine amidase
MRYQTLHRIQRILAIISFASLITIGLIVVRMAGVDLPGLNSLIPQGFVSAAFAKNVALISGHAGNDSGAVCTGADGNTTVTEAAINADVAGRVAQRLRRAGADVLILEEYDSRLAGLQADVLLSLHADSCIDASGYKAARHPGSPIAAIEDRLVRCIDEVYASATNLSRHADTITHNMTLYHAFGRIDPATPAAILELGFIGGDQNLLVNHAGVVAGGVADSLLCFLSEESEPNDATPVP